MKKVFFALLSVLAFAFTSCKLDNATVTVSVTDKEGSPVAFREVFYIDKASRILDVVLPPSPDELIGIDEGSWEYVKTNKSGTVTFKILMGVAKANYYFIVFDEGSKQWVEKEVTLQRGLNEQVDLEVNM